MACEYIYGKRYLLTTLAFVLSSFAESRRHFSQNLSSSGFLPNSEAPGISSPNRTHECDAHAMFILAKTRVWPTSLASVCLIKIPPDYLAWCIVYKLPVGG